ATRGRLSELRAYALICDSQAHAAASDAADLRADPSSVAFVQYTSGTTGSPRGAMVTHKNLLDNAEMVKQAMGHDANTRFVGWLPLFHDMGLVGNVFQPFYLGVCAVLMTPASFFQCPFRWLSAITEYGATTSGGPSFAYDHCVKRVTPQQRRQLDLSSWKVAFTGAAPISADTMQRFQRSVRGGGVSRLGFLP